MSFTIAEAERVIDRYAPVLLLHRDEKFVPVRADRFLEGCALWCNKPPTRTKDTWGNCAELEEDEEVPFPHQPQIPKGGLSLDPADDLEGAGGKWFLGHVNDDATRPYTVSNDQVEHFLEHTGWMELGPHGTFQPDPPVDTQTVNKSAAVDAAAERWQDEEALQGAKHWYYAEAFCVTSAMAPALPPAFGGGLVNALLNRLPSGFWLAIYYFLFPMHEEPLPACEHLVEDRHPSLDGEIQSPPSNGNYEGDWQALAVVVPAPGTPSAPVSPLALPPDQFPQPLWVAVGQRARGLIEVITADKFAFVERQIFRVADVAKGEVGLLDLHPKIFVARDSHNLYTAGGRQGTPAFDVVEARSACDRTEQALQIEQDVRQDLEKAKATAITLAKVLVGLLAGGLIGGIAGGISALVEASNRPDPLGPVDTHDDPGDFPPSSKKIGLALVPPDVLAAAQDEFAESAETIRVWPGQPSQHRVRPNDLWWPSWMGNPAGYQGRWGVVCTIDPFSRRAGIPFPDFRTALANELALELST